MIKLNLGSELSKNEQKKVKGGATLQCNSGYGPVYSFNGCASAASYCAGAQGSTVQYCY